VKKPYPGLQLNEDMPLQERTWRLERIGWTITLLFVLAALAGLLGPGPLSNAHAVTPDQSIEVQHLRFSRTLTPQSLRVRCRTNDAVASIWISNALLEPFSVEGVSPEPVETTIGELGITYKFNMSAARIDKSRAAADETPAVEWQLRPNRCGLIKGRIGSSPENAVAIWQLVYP